MFGEGEPKRKNAYQAKKDQSPWGEGGGMGFDPFGGMEGSWWGELPVPEEPNQRWKAARKNPKLGQKIYEEQGAGTPRAAGTQAYVEQMHQLNMEDAILKGQEKAQLDWAKRQRRAQLTARAGTSATDAAGRAASAGAQMGWDVTKKGAGLLGRVVKAGATALGAYALNKYNQRQEKKAAQKQPASSKKSDPGNSTVIDGTFREK
jgi:hypothetical protein